MHFINYSVKKQKDINIISNIFIESMNILLKSFKILKNHLDLLNHSKILKSIKTFTFSFTFIIFLNITAINNQIKKRKAIIQSSTSITAKKFLNEAKSQLLQAFKIINEIKILKTLDHIVHVIKDI